MKRRYIFFSRKESLMVSMNHKTWKVSSYCKRYQSTKGLFMLFSLIGRVLCWNFLER